MTKRKETEAETMDRLADDFASYCRKMFMASDGRIVAVSVRDVQNEGQMLGWYSPIDPHTAQVLISMAVDAANAQNEQAAAGAMH